MSNLLDPDQEFQGFNIEELRNMMSRGNESVLRRGRAMLELGRRAANDPALLQEVSDMIRAPENRRLVTIGTTSISQLGAAGLIAGGGEQATDRAAELVTEWTSNEQSDFAWLMKSAGVTWR